MTDERKISLPRLSKVALENFDIYSRKPNAVASIERDIFCVIGANGLGKSTLLNTINFAVTGAIPDPNRRFQSAQDYYKNASRLERTEEYFTGRISEISRRIASVTVELSWPTVSLAVTRDIFGTTGISRIEVRDLVSGQSSVTTLVDSPDGELDNLYLSKVLELTALDEFAQFVFLFHFIATFDEGRHLLMWDDAALTNALYLAFGADPSEAKRADKLQNDMDRESSRARNVKFSARHVTERINILTDVMKGGDAGDRASDAELQLQHEKLLAAQSDAGERLRRKQADLRDADLKWTDLSATLTEAQLEYRKAFSTRVRKSSSVHHHPLIRATLSENRCAVCSTEGVGAAIQQQIDKGLCPLCSSAVEVGGDDDAAVATLQKIDKQISSVRDKLATILATRERVSAEVVAAQAALDGASSALAAFEESEAGKLAGAEATAGLSSLASEIEKLEKERAAFQAQSEEHYKKRNEIREKLRGFEKQLKERYDKGAQQFVPRFRELAEAFIGLPIDVELEQRQGANDSGFGLRLRMDDQLRSLPDKVSESQRFFIDIALRMSLLEYMTAGPATLLIDTPEGSLDIAYEARAGTMFSKFVEAGNAIVMTANVRSSQLILRLATLQKKRGMQIVRMTDWTDLSEVQQSEEKLFTDAYEAIEAALK